MNMFKKIWNKLFNTKPEFPAKSESMSQLDYDIDKKLYELEIKDEKETYGEYLARTDATMPVKGTPEYEKNEKDKQTFFEQIKKARESMKPVYDTPDDVSEIHKYRTFSNFITPQYKEQRTILKKGGFTDDEILKILGSKEDYINNLLNSPDEIEKFNNHTDIKHVFANRSRDYKQTPEEKKVELKRIAEEYKEKAKIEIPKLQAARSKAIKKKKTLASKKRKK